MTAVKAGSATITVKTTDGGYTATCSVTVKTPDPVAVPEAVDLGLPSGLKWASFNLGASKPEEYGGYYQWAGLEDVTNTSIYLDWGNCPYHTGSDSETGWTKYIPSDYSSYWSGSGSPDNKTVLDSSDDVAHVKLGSKWRMPTRTEWTELIESCTWTLTRQNGMLCYEVRSKIAGYNNMFIILPSAGYVSGRGSAYGTFGRYWSSSLCASYPNQALILGFDIDGADGTIDIYRSNRYCGFSVRPVSE